MELKYIDLAPRSVTNEVGSTTGRKAKPKEFSLQNHLMSMRSSAKRVELTYISVQLSMSTIQCTI